MCHSRGRGFTITFRNIKAICKDEGQSRCQRIMSWVVAAVLVEKRLGIIGYCTQIWALVLETGPVPLHKVKEGHGSIWTTFKSCIKVISVGSVMCFSSSSYCFSSSHFFTTVEFWLDTDDRKWLVTIEVEQKQFIRQRNPFIRHRNPFYPSEEPIFICHRNPNSNWQGRATDNFIG